MRRLLMRPAEVVDLLGISRTKVYALIASGELPSMKVGESVRVPVAALQRWLEERVPGSAGEIGFEEERGIGR